MVEPLDGERLKVPPEERLNLPLVVAVVHSRRGLQLRLGGLWSGVVLRDFLVCKGSENSVCLKNNLGKDAPIGNTADFLKFQSFRTTSYITVRLTNNNTPDMDQVVSG